MEISGAEFCVFVTREGKLPRNRLMSVLMMLLTLRRLGMTTDESVIGSFPENFAALQGVELWPHPC